MRTNVLTRGIMSVALMGGAALAQQPRPDQPGRHGRMPEAHRAGGPAWGPQRQPGPGPQPQRGGGMPHQGLDSRMRPHGPPPNMGPGPQPEGAGPRQRPQGRPGVERLKELGATEQQMAALRKVGEEQQFKKLDLHAAVQKAELALGHALQAEKPDEAKVFQAVEALNRARGEALKQDVASRLKAREILGAELSAKLHKQRVGAARGPQGPRPDGPRPGGPRPGGPRPDGLRPDGLRPDGPRPGGPRPGGPPPPLPGEPRE